MTAFAEIIKPTWANSKVRKWLNSTFMNMVFNKKEQACIEVTTVVTPDNSLWVEYRKATNRKYEAVSDGRETKDKLFLLSAEEVLELCGLNTIQEQLDSVEAREMMKAIATKHAEYAGAFVYHGGMEEYKYENGKRIAFSAHMDHIGFVVTDIDENGFLRVNNVGGINQSISNARHVLFENGTEDRSRFSI